MKPQNDTANSHAGPPEPARADNDQATGLPGLHTWRGVYVFVFVSFVVWVGLLAALTVMFS